MGRTAIWMRAVSLLVIVLLTMPMATMAQNDGNERENFSKEQLAQLLAPIALYPDELIAQILMASTYPLEIVMADRWARQHKELQGEELARALEEQTWDPSVKSLVNFPSVLAMLSEKLDLTTKLGDAFLQQKQDVMDTIQELRRRAAAAGNLKTTSEQKVVVEKETIVIEPVTPDVVYVPIYDPFVVYGPWWYPAYPPFYFYPAPSVVFTFGFGITLGWPWGYAWGGCDWRHRDIIININRNLAFNRFIDRARYIRRFEERRIVGPTGRGVWAHNPVHRRGVAYVNRATAQRFGQMPARAIENRREVRGFGSAGRFAPLPRAVSPPPQPRGGGAREGVSVPRTERRGIRVERGEVSRPATPGPRRESVFTGRFGQGEQVRRSSERGRASFGRGGFPRGFSQPRGGGGRGFERRR
ncbi:DUF3300 domain-containing protein [Geobacter sp.]|uniref:DUF3300 domain-containing protein n=1 Tax=Geobacter sp. TaxID=46610 RepID=UPI00262C8303|nr:DUF3300 domain-containing protein [Geobacter sp.]